MQSAPFASSGTGFPPFAFTSAAAFLSSASAFTPTRDRPSVARIAAWFSASEPSMPFSALPADKANKKQVV